MKQIYQKGSDLCLFFEPELLAAACIYLGNKKCLDSLEMARDLHREFGLTGFLDDCWLARVYSRYLRMVGGDPSQYNL